ncbi:MAG: hypothetical protein K0Q50_1527 [Vampirovibrio sp.]|jgi:hypothetical protein|nr:hypothetical protein [Vampirovibrio sp.]
MAPLFNFEDGSVTMIRSAPCPAKPVPVVMAKKVFLSFLFRQQPHDLRNYPVTFRSPSTTLISLSLMLGLFCPQAEWAYAASDFGANWKATPLVDTSIVKQPVAENKQQPANPFPPVQPELETRLKPAEPFIKDVETKLFITPAASSPLVQRLNNLQNVLFGESKYDDAGELLAKLAEMFPKEAAKANAELNKQLQSSLPPLKSPTTSSKPGKTRKPSVTQAPSTIGAFPAQTATVQSAPTKGKKQKKRFWQDDWDNTFDNDPFFRDEPQQRVQSNPQGPSKLAAVGQGITSLALIAGSLAGTYYLNKNNNGGYYPNNGYYNNGYYNNGYYGYGTPYGAYPYGTYTYGAPVVGGYPGYYNYSAPQLNYIPRTFTQTPYTPSYFGSRFGATSTPLGVPTGITRY